MELCTPPLPRHLVNPNGALFGLNFKYLFFFLSRGANLQKAPFEPSEMVVWGFLPTNPGDLPPGLRDSQNPKITSLPSLSHEQSCSRFRVTGSLLSLPLRLSSSHSRRGPITRSRCPSSRVQWSAGPSTALPNFKQLPPNIIVLGLGSSQRTLLA